MLRLFHKPDPEGSLVELDISFLGSIQEGWVWLDVEGEPPESITTLGQRFGFDELAIEDASEASQFPKVDDFEDYLFIVLHGLTARDDRLDTNELDSFVGSGYLVTIHHDEVPALGWVRDRALEIPRAAAGGPDRMLARIADAQSRRYLPIIEALEERVDDLEERAIEGDPSVVGEDLALRRDVVTLRRVVGPQRDALQNLSRSGSPMLSARAKLRFADVFDRHVRIVESLDAARSILGAVFDSYRSTVAERTNEAMKVLTVFAAILLPLGLLAGIYGMNFANMPGLRTAWGFAAVVAVMVVVAVGEWIYFARRGFVGKFRPGRIPRAVGSGLAQLAVLPVRAVGGLVEHTAGRRRGTNPR